MDQQTALFTNKSLGKMIIPLFLEQLLVMLVGLADTLIISYAGEAASQLLAFSAVFSLLIAILVLIEKERMLVHHCFEALAGVSMGSVFITVIGQCMGSGDTTAAEYYFKKLTRITLLISSVWNLLVFWITPVFLRFYDLETETKQLVIWLVGIHNLFNAVAFPFSGALSNGLRAAGDVKFTMYVSVISTIVVRLLLSYILGIPHIFSRFIFPVILTVLTS